MLTRFHQEHRALFDTPQGVHFSKRHEQKWLDPGDAGVIDQSVDGTTGLDNTVDPDREGCRIGNVQIPAVDGLTAGIVDIALKRAHNDTRPGIVTGNGEQRGVLNTDPVVLK